MSPFHKDKTVLLDGIEMRILRHLGACEVQLENVKSGEIKTYRLEELLKHYCDGTLLYTERRRIRRQKEAPADRGQICTAHLSPAALHGSRRRMDYIQNLKGQGSFGKPRPQVKEDIATICARRGEPVAPSMSTVYRWYKQYLDAEKDVRALFCRFDRRGGKGSTRLHPDVEAIVHDKIETVFLAGPARSAEEVHNAVVATVARENATRVGSDQLNAPGLRTLQRRLNNHYAYDVTVAKYGELEANRRFRCSVRPAPSSGSWRSLKSITRRSTSW